MGYGCGTAFFGFLIFLVTVALLFKLGVMVYVRDVFIYLAQFLSFFLKDLMNTGQNGFSNYDLINM